MSGANPDDPVVPPPAPAIDDSESPGRLAVVEAQVYIVSVLLVGQLWLATVTLREWLSGHREHLWSLAAASGVAFLIAWGVKRWATTR